MSIHHHSQALEWLDHVIERVEIWQSRYQRRLDPELQESLKCAHGDLTKVYDAYRAQVRRKKNRGGQT